MLAAAIHLVALVAVADRADTVRVHHLGCVSAAVAACIREEGCTADTMPLVLLPFLIDCHASYGIRLVRDRTGYDKAEPLPRKANAGEAYTLVSGAGVRYTMSYAIEYDNGRIDNTVSPPTFACNVLVTIALKGGDVNLRYTHLMPGDVSHLGHVDSQHRYSFFTGQFHSPSASQK